MKKKCRCTRCGFLKEEGWPSYYARVIASKKKRDFICRECKRIVNLFSNPERCAENEVRLQKRNERKKELISEHEKEFLRFKAFGIENEFARQYLEECQNNIRDRNKKWQEDNPEKLAFSLKKYWASEKGIKTAKRRLALRCRRIRDQVEYLSELEKKKIAEFYINCPKGHHVDHIFPIAKGGKHCLENLQYLSKKENLSKGNKILKYDETLIFDHKKAKKNLLKIERKKSSKTIKIKKEKVKKIPKWIDVTKP